jgi:hypothetical protein
LIGQLGDGGFDEAGHFGLRRRGGGRQFLVGELCSEVE